MRHRACYNFVMNIPQSNRRKTLIIVDVQESFLDDRSRYIVPNILELLATTRYDRYVVATFHAEAGSLWEKQQDWTCPPGEGTKTVPEILSALAQFSPLVVEKETRSVFKGIPGIVGSLRESGIEEIHIVGTQTNDCILATAFESFDLGFLTYVIEECCEAESTQLHEAGLALLRAQNMTNHSILIA
jgi:nicotinamidase-related amidase